MSENQSFGSGFGYEEGVAGESTTDTEEVNAALEEMLEEADEKPSTGGKSAAAKTKGKVGSSVPRAKTGQFSWSDVESIIRFVDKFEDAPEAHKRTFKNIFGVQLKSDALSVAQALHPSGGTIGVYRDATGLIDTIVSGNFGIPETFELISNLTKHDDDYVRDFFKVVNAFLQEEVKYRKQTPLPTLLSGLVTSAQSGLTAKDKEVIVWVDDLLEVWPK